MNLVTRRTSATRRAFASLLLLSITGCSAGTSTTATTNVTTATVATPSIPNLQLFADPSGTVATYTTAGLIDQTSPLFTALGTNGCTCATCHQPAQGMSLNTTASSPSSARPGAPTPSSQPSTEPTAPPSPPLVSPPLKPTTTSSPASPRLASPASPSTRSPAAKIPLASRHLHHDRPRRRPLLRPLRRHQPRQGPRPSRSRRPRTLLPQRLRRQPRPGRQLLQRPLPHGPQPAAED